MEGETSGVAKERGFWEGELVLSAGRGVVLRCGTSGSGPWVEGGVGWGRGWGGIEGVCGMDSLSWSERSLHHLDS